MWSLKTIRSIQRLPEHFGLIVTQFSSRPESEEHSSEWNREWYAKISIKVRSADSAWEVGFLGMETKQLAPLAALRVKDDTIKHEYSVRIDACLLQNGSIRLQRQGGDADWEKLQGLWLRLWDELERQGFRDVTGSPLTSNETQRPKRLGGRPRNADDDWAWEQVNELRRDPRGVYPEWLARIGERKNTLSDAQDSFDKAVRPERGKKREDSE